MADTAATFVLDEKSPRSVSERGDRFSDPRPLDSSAELASRPGKHYLLTVMALCDSVIGSVKVEGNRIAEEINETLEKYRNPERQDIEWQSSAVWEDAFLCERLVVKILPKEDLQIEIERRIFEVSKFDRELGRFYRQNIIVRSGGDQELTARDVEVNRAVLGRIIRDLHYFLNSLELKRRYATLAQKRVYQMFFVALVAFAVVLPITVQLMDAGPPPEQGESENGGV